MINNLVIGPLSYTHLAFGYLKKADGLTPGEHFFLPESGEAEFSLTFEPLPFDTKRFNFTEGTSEKDWQINGIKLTK